MKAFLAKAVMGCSALVLAGCSGANVLDSQPLFFSQGVTLGVTGGTAPQNGNTPEFTLGFKQANVALVPTVMPGVVEDSNGNQRQLTKDILINTKILGQDTQSAGNAGAQDALSTFGSFEADTGPTKGNLGVFFATGVAAQKLADGFKENLSNTPAPSPAQAPATATQ